MKFNKGIFKIILWIICVGFFGYILLVIFLLFAPKLNSYAHRVSFESSEWKNHLKDHDPVKLRMVDDLLSQHMLVGYTIEQVDQLLGKPPKTYYFKNYDYVYWLGNERSAMSADSEWLGIKFQNGIVVKVDIVKD